MINIPYYETSNFVFSNFSAHLVEFKGVHYATVEHAFHAQKFTDDMLQQKIRECTSPLAAWQLAQELKPQRRVGWDDIKVGVLTDIIRVKVQQHTEVRDALLATQQTEIIEVNPNDDFWGSGPDGNGQNNTGKILMKIRNELRHEQN